MKKTYICLILLILICIIGFFCLNDVLFTMSSVDSIEDGKLYEMNYSMDYNLNDLVKSNATTPNKLFDYIFSQAIGLSNFGCSAFSAKSVNGDSLVGRNYDFAYDNPNQYSPILIVENHPKNAYSSISIVDLSFLGYNSTHLPDNFFNDVNLLGAILAPMDGMNEKGVFIGVLGVPGHPTMQNTTKDKVATTSIMRIVLDNCSSVDDAVMTFKKYDIQDITAMENMSYHYFISDSKGDSAIIEFENNTINVIKKDSNDSYQVLTNHYISNNSQNADFGNVDSVGRYNTIKEALDNYNGSLTYDEAANILDDAKCNNMIYTQYSSLYDLNKKELIIYSHQDFNKNYTFDLK